MTISQGLTTVFKQNCLSGRENFAAGTTYVYKVALYTALADLSYSTLTYTTLNEITGTGYTSGGKILTISQVPASSDQTAYVSFANVTWNPASFTTRGALIYNSTTGAAVAVLDFGADKTCTSTFTITFPTASAADAIIRISN
jgi:hypothetical protein